MKRKLLLILLLFSAITYAQNAKFNIQEKEQILKKIIAAQPDSAKVIIKQILNYKGTLPDTVYANAYIFYGYYYNLKNNLDSALIYYNKADTYTDDPAYYARILRNKAAIYRKKADYPKSLKLLGIAEEKYNALNDDAGLALVYGEIASNYNQILKGQEAIPYLLKALALLEKKGLPIHIFPVKQSLANTYMNVGNFNFAMDLYKETLEGFKEHNLIKNYYLTLINYGDCHIYLKRNTEAKKILTEAIQGLEKFNDHELIAVAFSKLGRIAAEEKNYVQASSYYNSAFKKALTTNSSKLLRITSEYLTTLNFLKQYSEALSIIQLVDKHPANEKSNVEDKLVYETAKTEIYQNNNNNELALVALKNKLQLLDTVIKTDNDDVVLKIQAGYQNDYQQKKNMQLKKANAVLAKQVAADNKIKILKVVIVIAALLILFIIYSYNRKLHREKLKMAETDKLMVKQQLEHEREINQTLTENIKDKQNELASNAVMVAAVMDNINLVIALCANNTKDDDIETIKNELQQLISDEDYWVLFKERFNEVNANYQKKLNQLYPQLTKNDLFFCSILNLKMSYKDTAKLIQITPESIVKKKYRIKKRIGAASEAELDRILSENNILVQH